ncbi:MAG: hypothetical protein M1826_003031 [Phylliscum demangeonii]|nr:MAG: hypothetical protein M1826_003031 [Phylliscum demangeonii]
MTSKKKNRQAKRARQRQMGLLTAGRPRKPNTQPAMSSRTTRNVIRSYHKLEKQRNSALERGDSELAQDLAARMEAQGGLEGYQRASLQGQAKQRGGDSSKVLCDWFRPALDSAESGGNGRIRVLEIGALRADNACSRLSRFDVTRIDLNSQDENIQQQDFMNRPLPLNDQERFDVISLSLVLNFVAAPLARGEMLLRTTQFLRLTQPSTEVRELLPSLFLVLPLPCVDNSRYLTEDRLKDIMGSMGYVLVKQTTSARMVYYLWRYECETFRADGVFRKVEVHSGSTRNNFAITRQ